MINAFQGFTTPQIVSSVLAFLLFNFFVLFEALALAAFYVGSKPVRGHYRRAPIWFFVAALWFILSIIATVWAAPAEKSFTDDTGVSYFWQVSVPGNLFGVPDRLFKVLIGLVFWAVGVGFLMLGVALGRGEKRALRDAALYEDDDVALPRGVALP